MYIWHTVVVYLLPKLHHRMLTKAIFYDGMSKESSWQWDFTQSNSTQLQELKRHTLHFFLPLPHPLWFTHVYPSLFLCLSLRRYRVALRLSLAKLRQMFQQRSKKDSISQSTATQPASARESCSSAAPPPATAPPASQVFSKNLPSIPRDTSVSVSTTTSASPVVSILQDWVYHSVHNNGLQKTLAKKHKQTQSYMP